MSMYTREFISEAIAIIKKSGPKDEIGLALRDAHFILASGKSTLEGRMRESSPILVEALAKDVSKQLIADLKTAAKDKDEHTFGLIAKDIGIVMSVLLSFDDHGDFREDYARREFGGIGDYGLAIFKGIYNDSFFEIRDEIFRA